MTGRHKNEYFAPTMMHLTKTTGKKVNTNTNVPPTMLYSKFEVPLLKKSMNTDLSVHTA